MFYESFRARHDVIAVKPRFGDAFLRNRAQSQDHDGTGAALSFRGRYHVIAVKPRFGDAFFKKRVRSQGNGVLAATLAVDVPRSETGRKRRGRPKTKTVLYKHFLMVAAELLIWLGESRDAGPQNVSLAIVGRLSKIFPSLNLQHHLAVTYANNIARYLEPRNNHVYREFHGGQIHSRGRSKGLKRDSGIAGLAAYAGVRKYVLHLAHVDDLASIRPRLSYEEILMLYVVKDCCERIRLITKYRLEAMESLLS